MMVIGITGQFCAGKSTVAKMLAGLCDAKIIDADKIGHSVLGEPGVRKQLIASFGKDIASKSGRIDRKKLAVVAFANRRSHKLLCRVVHPLLVGAILNKLKQIKLKNPKAVVVIDAAVLVEMGLLRFIDKLIVVTINRKEQTERAIAKCNLSKEDINKRIKLQIPSSRLIKKADFIIDNNRSLKSSKRQVENFWRKYGN